MTQLSEHFSLEELTFSETAQRDGIDNTPSTDIINALTFTASQLELVRSLLVDKPMHIDSGYRCPALNKEVHGVQDSAHLSGFAVDFICSDFGTPLDIVRQLNSSQIKFDQVIEEGTWVHISFAPAMRQQVLTAHFDGDKATYRLGV
jgi:hypothetical protein